MRVFDVNVLSYGKDSGAYTIQYCVESVPGVIRRSKATLVGDVLSRDFNVPTLIEQVAEKVRLFNISR